MNLYISIIPLAFVISEFSNLITWRSKLKPLNFVINKLGCLKCLTFWLTLILTKDILTACCFSMGAYIVDKHIL